VLHNLSLEEHEESTEKLFERSHFEWMVKGFEPQIINNANL